MSDEVKVLHRLSVEDGWAEEFAYICGSRAWRLVLPDGTKKDWMPVDSQDFYPLEIINLATRLAAVERELAAARRALVMTHWELYADDNSANRGMVTGDDVNFCHQQAKLANDALARAAELGQEGETKC